MGYGAMGIEQEGIIVPIYGYTNIRTAVPVDDITRTQS